MTTALQYAERDGTVHALDVDAVLHEANTAISEVSDNPVELGADVTDHIRDKSDAITIEFVISNTPTRVPTSHADGVTGAVRDNGGRGVVLSFDAQFDRVRAVREDLARVKKLGLLWRIETALRVYEDFLIEQMVVDRDATSGKSAKFTLQMRRAIFVSTRFVAVPVLQPRTRPRTRQGNQPTRPPRNPALLQGFRAVTRAFN